MAARPPRGALDASMLTSERFVQWCLAQDARAAPTAVDASSLQPVPTFAEQLLTFLFESKGEVRNWRERPSPQPGQLRCTPLPMASPKRLLCWDRSTGVPERPSVILLEFSESAMAQWLDGTATRRRPNRAFGDLERALLQFLEAIRTGDRVEFAMCAGQPAPAGNDELLYVIAMTDARNSERGQILLFAAWNPSLGCFETFYMRGEARHWEQGIASRYLTGIFQRNLSAIVGRGMDWRQAFSRLAERECLETLCREIAHGVPRQRSAEQCIVELFRHIAVSFAPEGKSAPCSLDVLWQTHPNGSVRPESLAGDVAPIEDGPGEIVIRDTTGFLRNWQIVVLTEPAAIEQRRRRAKAEAPYRNLLLLHLRVDGVTLELCDGRRSDAFHLHPDCPRRELVRVVEHCAREFLFSAVTPRGTEALAEMLALQGHALCRAAHAELLRTSERTRFGRAFAQYRQVQGNERASAGVFADAVAQTLLVSLFAARWLQSIHDDAPARRFTRTSAGWGSGCGDGWYQSLLVALVLEDTESHAHLRWQVDASIELLDRIDLRRAFAAERRGVTQDPILHFCEVFLRAYDPKSRTQLGAFYTPQPVVSYIVRSVHELLKREFGLEAGLADTATWRSVVARLPQLKPEQRADETPDEFLQLLDEPFVQVLDPATGTGIFLIETIEVVYQTHREQSRARGRSEAESQAAWNEYVPRQLLPRLFAFELALAPYVIARLNVALKLIETGYRFTAPPQIQIFLTNALEPATSDAVQSIVHDTLDDRARLNSIKRRQRFSVIVGNPPYAGHSRNNAIDWIRNLVKDYTRADRELCGPGQGKWLQDDYVKFLRLGQYLTTRASVGILAMVTNHRYLTNRTFREMRRQWCACYPFGMILDLHGNRGVQEAGPEQGDENVFDIDQGVAVGTFVRGGSSPPRYTHRDLWGPRRTADGKGKYDFLERHDALSTDCDALQPASPHWSFAPSSSNAEALRAEFDACLSMLELMPGTLGPNGKPQSGIATMQDRFALGFSSEEVARNVRQFLTTSSREHAKSMFGTLCNPQQWDYDAAKRALGSGGWQDKVTPIWFMPLDLRHTVYDGSVAVHLRRRLSEHLFRRDNLALVIGEAGQEVSGAEWDAVSCVDGILQLNFFRRNGSPTLPLFLYGDQSAAGKVVPRQVNLSPSALRRIADVLALPVTDDGLVQGLSPHDIFHYAYAIFHSPTYRSRYALLLRNEFPRLPLTGRLELFRSLVELGGKLVAAHLMKSSAELSVSVECVGPELPRIETVSWANDCVWLDEARRSGFVGVSRQVWEHHIGGYRICQKWLKDRRQRVLTRGDIGRYRHIVAAIAETRETMAQIDQVLERHGGWRRAFTAHGRAELT